MQQKNTFFVFFVDIDINIIYIAADDRSRAYIEATKQMAELLTVKEAAEYLRVNPQWLYLQIQSGRIPAIRLRGDKGPWRIDKARLQQWLEDQHFQVGEEAEAEAA